MQSFDGIRALGERIVCEQAGTERRMASGLVAPEPAPVWRCISVGPLHKHGAQIGDRIGFRNANVLENNGKRYAVIDPLEILFALPFVEGSYDAEPARIVVPAVNVLVQ